MKSFRTRLLGIGTVVTLLCLPVLWLQADDEGHQPVADETPLLMRAKLSSSQKILEGLVTKDFQVIGKGSEELVRLTDAEIFKKPRDPVYQHYSHEFRRQAKKLGRLAADGNMDGVTFTYMRLTSTCIDCHDYMRDVLKLTDKGDDEGVIRLLQTDVGR